MKLKFVFFCDCRRPVLSNCHHRDCFYQKYFSFAMEQLFLVLSTILVYTNGLFYIERYTVRTTSLAEINISYIHDEAGNCITNLTLSTFTTLTKSLLYITGKAADNKDDREYRILLLQTVADVEKSFKNLQTNFLMKGFMANIIKSMDFKVKYPFLPVSIE